MLIGRSPDRSMYLIFPVFQKVGLYLCPPLVALELLQVLLALPVLVMVLDLPLVVLPLPLV